ncbi:DUF805 domain-containing protein [Fulvivirga kasyanovii]|uniref:DUF805 domain-containing protein n=1 Tax=Fulvivirga kasyanovii TaxID=396812 RepID=A0ABW9RYI3_9BACT|nr:DUF805 domain-containing protein [Fulvivirga kasyanovii]MTI28767.1 DUF805 domain-containing protein [Fulvivirga kasyanovii]
MYWYLTVFKKYSKFYGRARRKEFWMFMLFNMLALILAMITDVNAGTVFIEPGFGLFSIIYMVVAFVPTMAVGVRRLHDIGEGGQLLLLGLVPLLGAAWLLILLAKDGNPGGGNQYGRCQK